MNHHPIGIFDSGVGGLSVLLQIRAGLPDESLIYVADSGHAPYGDKSTAFIIARAVDITDFLLSQGAKALVVACNTATAAAIALLRERYTLPIIGIEPAVKPAISTTHSGIVGVLATHQTVHSHKFSALLNRCGGHGRVIVQECPGLADCVEQGALDSPQTEALLRHYVQPLLAQGADTVVLGCTHYPFLRPLLERLTGPAVTILDPSPAVARQLQRQLAAHALLATPHTTPPSLRYVTSGAPEQLLPVMCRLLGEPIVLEILPEPFGKSL